MRLLELKQKTQCAAIRAAACGEFPTLATLQTALDSGERNEAPSNAMRSKRLKTSTAFCLHKNTSGSRFFLNDSSCNSSFLKKCAIILANIQATIHGPSMFAQWLALSYPSEPLDFHVFILHYTFHNRCCCYMLLHVAIQCYILLLCPTFVASRSLVEHTFLEAE